MTQTVAAPTAAFDVGPWLAGLGGAGNVVEAGLKAGRVCVRLVDPAALDEAALTARGARGVARLADGSVQILLRPA